jgi:hypothetical protein
MGFTCFTPGITGNRETKLTTQTKPAKRKTTPLEWKEYLRELLGENSTGRRYKIQ